MGTGDLALNVDPAPGESRQGERSIILVGRVGDAVKVRGMFLHPNQLRFAVPQVSGVCAFRAVVTRPRHRDELTLHLVVDADGQPDAVRAGVEQAVRSVCRIKIDAVDFVEQLEEGALIEDRRQLLA